MKEVSVKSIAHITGGGFFENVPRALPEGKRAVIKKSDVRIHPIFDVIQKRGGIPTEDMFSTFNMGVGMMIILSAQDAEKAIEILRANGEDAYIVGKIENGEKGVELC